MQYDSVDTIVAIGTAGGSAARGMIRIAGPQALACVEGLIASASNANVLTSLRNVCVLPASIRLSGNRELLVDCELYVWPNEKSYTRSPLVELHLTGSAPLLQAVVGELCRQGARLAGPGEFTLRAFLAGRIDLAQAEAVLGVIDARGEDDLRSALRQLAGGLSAPLEKLRNQLLDLLAHLEAGLDFVEDDVEFITQTELVGELTDAAEVLSHIAATLAERSESTETIKIVLVGDPNVGKSSLYNAMVRRALGKSDSAMVEALVSPITGTTRDYLSIRLDLAGHPCELIDTAGVRTGIDCRLSDDGIAEAAQRSTESSQQRGQLFLLCFDSSRAMTPHELERLGCADNRSLVIFTKADLPMVATPPLGAVITTSTQEAGVDALIQRLVARMEQLDDQPTGSVMATAVRCRESIRLAGEALQRSHELAAMGGREELVASEVRIALNELGQVVGAVYTDDILDRVFSRFCIGK